MKQFWKHVFVWYQCTTKRCLQNVRLVNKRPYHGSIQQHKIIVVVYPLPWPWLVRGVRSSRVCSTSQLRRPSCQQCSYSGGLCPQFDEGWFICSELGKGVTSAAGSISSELLMCGGGVCSSLLLPRVVRCIETIYVCMCVYACGCSAASNWKPGPHAVSTIVKCL